MFKMCRKRNEEKGNFALKLHKKSGRALFKVHCQIFGIGLQLNGRGYMDL